jgi:transcriptional regulator GlxA family with amidase domain
MRGPASPFPLLPAGAKGPALVDVLLLPEFSLMSLAATLEPLRAANRVAAQELYRWRLLACDAATVTSSSGVTLQANGCFAADEPRDVLIVVAAFNARRYATPVLPGLRRLARRGVPLGGIESGSWALARAGLLDGHRATAHWEELEEFAAAFPAIEVVADRYVVDRARFTAGGAAPALDMILNMLRAQHGLALALDVASVFIYDPRPTAEDEQRIVSLGRLAGGDPELAEAIRCMQAHLDEPVSVRVVAKRVGMSTRALQLRFRARLGMSPYTYYRNLRLSAARRMLQQTECSAAEVAVAYGFGSGSAFARAFRGRYAVSPMEARKLAGDPSPWLTGAWPR